MLIQILVGTVPLFLSIVLAGLAFAVIEPVMRGLSDWLIRPPHRLKLLALLCGSVLWILVTITLGVFLWAGTFVLLDVFPTAEEAVYFALVAYTTLGFGDLLLAEEWRLLGGMAAANGFLTFGFITAALVNIMQQIRLSQLEQQREKAREVREAQTRRSKTP